MNVARLLAYALIPLVLVTAGCTEPEVADDTPAEPAAPTYEHPGVLDPTQAAEQAPDTFKARFDTTKGEFVIEVTRKWAPLGADRFYNLVKIGYFDGVKFFRVVDGFMAQFGIHPDPAVNTAWQKSQFKDDPVVKANRRGYVTYAKTGLPNSRSVQVFINYQNNTPLDGQGFAPFGKVIEGMEVVDRLYSGYGEKTTNLQGDMMARGDEALMKFPMLDQIKTARLID